MAAIYLDSTKANLSAESTSKLPTNCLSVFEHFVGLALKGLILQSMELSC